MKRLAVLLPLLTALAVHAGDEEVKMPDAIEQADKRYEDSVKQANAIRLKVYERELQNATRAGNLDLANAIKKRMEAITEAPPAATSIEGNSGVFEGAKYEYVPNRMSWHAAKAHAESLGGSLVIIESPAENDFVRKLAAGRPAWIGATKTGPRWEWITGEPVRRAYWMPGGETSGSFAHLHGDHGMWNGTIPNNPHMEGLIVEWPKP